jgi:hypothetical protein
VQLGPVENISMVELVVDMGVVTEQQVSSSAAIFQRLSDCRMYKHANTQGCVRGRARAGTLLPECERSILR